MAEQQTSQGTHQEACREDAKRRNQRRDRVLRREEVAPDVGGKIAVNTEIVPLHNVAGDACNYGASFPRRFRAHPQTPTPPFCLAPMFDVTSRALARI